MSTRALVLTLAVCLSAAGQPNAQQAFLAPITADTLKAHVSFLASDALQGRNTPSPGLDVAAEYIASQFRRLGLQAAGNDGYFQIAPYAVVRQPMENFELTIESGGKTWKAPKDRVVASAAVAVSLNGVEVVKVLLPDENAALPAKEAVQGKAVVLVSGPTRSRAMTQKRQELLGLGPAIVVTAAFTGQAGSQLREAGAPAARRAPQVTTSDPEFTSFAEALADGARLSATIPAAVEEPVALKNVIATLPGSDPALKDSYVLLTAHYDHIGVSARGDGDRINNGANDDASGVASVLALAEAFSKLPQRPRRTLVFMTYFGEEKGLLGSRWYAAHPVFPLAQTVANLNFEHMGRTDDNDGPRAGRITASGFDYTTLGDVLTAAGKLTGVEAWKHERNSDAFFARSDNQALADAGIPAITVCVAWIFPDYHRPSDHWDKLDYENMRNAVATGAIAVSRVADSAEAPQWIESNPKVAKYFKAWRGLHGMH